MSDDAKAAPAKKKGKLARLLLIVMILVLLGGGGAGAFWWMSRQGAEPAKPGEHAAETHEDDSHAAAISLPTFTVNLADKETSRYLRTTLSLVISDADVAEELSGAGHGGGNVKLMKARSAILELLSMQTAEQISTPEGKETLKKAIAAKATKAFGAKVTDVLFSDFVVQF